MQYPERVIDVHTHLFNGHHLPLEAIFRTWLGVPGKPQNPSEHFLAWLAASARDLVVRLVDVAPPARERRRLSLASSSDEAIASEVHARALVAANRRMARTRASPSRRRSDSGLRTTSFTQPGADDPFIARLAEIELVYRQSGDSPSAPSTRTAYPLPTRRQVRARVARTTAASSGERLGAAAPTAVISQAAVEWLLKKIATVLLDWVKPFVGNFLEFFKRMTALEQANVEAIFRSYRPEQNVKLIVHLLMDMENWFRPEREEDPFWDLEQQFRRMSRVAQQNPGRVIGFAAFDPRRPDWRELCERAVDHYGFRGLKFYPPLGYRPSGNADAEVQQRIDGFFAFCVERDLPVFAHCAPMGFESRRGAGLNADPRYWRKTLERFPKLRLCLAHAGGGRNTNRDEKTGKVFKSAGWFARDDAEWRDDGNYARHVVDLCRTYPNVFCELGHLEEALKEDEQRHLLRNFDRAWNGTQGEYPFSTKCMYGSDWHMPLMVNATARYLEFFHAAFETQVGGPEAFKRFCHDNAVAYLKL